MIGIIAGASPGDPLIELPDTVDRGQPFEVRVATNGGGCSRKGDTEVRIEGLRAWVTPYDIEEHREFCTDIGNVYEHSATLRFNREGTARVTIRGRKFILLFDPETHESIGSSTELITVDRQVVVR